MVKLKTWRDIYNNEYDINGVNEAPLHGVTNVWTGTLIHG